MILSNSIEEKQLLFQKIKNWLLIIQCDIQRRNEIKKNITQVCPLQPDMAKRYFSNASKIFK